MASDDAVKVGGILCCIVLICSAFLLGYSFRKLEANEVGLNYSANSLTIEMDKLYESGVHFLGVGHSFFKFPKNVQQIDLKGGNSIGARTSDGLLVDLQVQLLFRLVIEKDALANLQLMFNGKYRDYYANIIRSVVRDVASDYTAFQFWQSRDNITQAMLARLSIVLGDVYGRVENFLLSNYDLPQTFDEAITETQNRIQEKERVQSEVEQETVETQTRVLKALKQAEIIGLEANATATAYLLSIDAEMVKIQTQVQAELSAYSTLMSELQFTPEELVTYVWLETLQKARSQKVLSVRKPHQLTI
jgi:regulator of protease activity HflC (stomatin/prohibitin superfamily)